MPSKALKATWSFFSFALLATGAVAIAFSIIWRATDPVKNFIISKMDLDAGLALGIMLVLTWMISIAGVLQQNHVTLGLIITNWVLIADAIAVLAVGAEIWFYTLQPKTNFLKQWVESSPQAQQVLQDTLLCCGFTNSTQSATFAGFCVDATFAAAQPGCSSVILPMADYTLNNVFSSIFGFMVVVIGFFLATVSLVYRRNEQERFRRIDEKRGGKSFV